MTDSNYRNGRPRVPANFLGDLDSHRRSTFVLDGPKRCVLGVLLVPHILVELLSSSRSLSENRKGILSRGACTSIFHWNTESSFHYTSNSFSVYRKQLIWIHFILWPFDSTYWTICMYVTCLWHWMAGPDQIPINNVCGLSEFRLDI